MVCICNRVVSYTSPIEAFATGIKMESSDQHSFRRQSRDQDDSEQLKSTDQCTFSDTKESWLRFVLWTPVKSRDQEPQNGAIKWSRTIFSDQDSWSRSQTLLQALHMWLPLDGPLWCMGSIMQPMQLGSENSARQSRVKCCLIPDCTACASNTTVDHPITTSHVTVGYLELQLDVRVGNLSKVSLGAW